MLDFLDLCSRLTPEERAIQQQLRKWLDSEAAPLIAEAWDAGEFPRSLMAPLAAHGVLGASLPTDYGCAGVSAAAYGLMMYELERIDSGLRSFASVQGALAMYPIWRYGSEAQRQTFLPNMASGELIGCFGLTESDGGSDPGAMRTRATAVEGGVRLNGSKMWITNGSIAGVAVVWAQSDAGIIGLLVDTAAEGFRANVIKRKMSLRASITCELVFDDVFVPDDRILPEARGLSAPLSCLTQARYGIAWGALGALEAVYTEALDYAGTRTTFGQPIAARQLVQEKLVSMVAAHSKGLLLVQRLAELKDAGKLDYGAVSLGKRDNVRAALDGARLAREILGGNGITTEYAAIRHMLNLETVDTYEGTHDIHTLILGRALTGHNALG